MTKHPVNIRLTPPIKAHVVERMTPDQGAPTVLARAVARYFEICGRSLPRFTTLQWEILHAAHEGYDLADPGAPIDLEGRVSAYLRDVHPARGRALPDIVSRVRSLSYAERVAVLDRIERMRAEAGR